MGRDHFLVAKTYRIEGHTVWRSASLTARKKRLPLKSPDRDPISRFGRRLETEFGFAESKLEEIRQQARTAIDEALQFAIDSPDPEVAALWKTSMREIQYREALNEALNEEMARDARYSCWARTLADTAACCRSRAGCWTSTAKGACAIRPSPRPASWASPWGAMTGMRRWPRSCTFASARWR